MVAMLENTEKEETRQTQAAKPAASVPIAEKSAHEARAQKPKRSVAEKSVGIKSRQRVRSNGEVFTQPREVNNILALTEATSNKYWRFLEPACGNGNFLEAILRQRMERLTQDRTEWHAKNREFSTLKVLSTIYGVDIAPDNIEECKKRLEGVIFEYLPKRVSAGFLLAMAEILRTNLIVGDMLNGKDKICFVEYITPVKNYFIRNVYRLTDMEEQKEAKPIYSYKMQKFNELTPIDEPMIPPDNSPPDLLAPKQTNLFGEPA